MQNKSSYIVPKLTEKNAEICHDHQRFSLVLAQQIGKFFVHTYQPHQRHIHVQVLIAIEHFCASEASSKKLQSSRT